MAFLKRLFLRSMRPFTSRVDNLVGQGQVLMLHKPFRFIFHRLEVRDSSGNVVGAIQKKWTWFRRKYIVEDANGRELATLFGPFWRPWTFRILPPGADHSQPQELGLVQKKWSGLLKEAFSQADNFWVTFEGVTDPQLRALLFSATVLIDMVHFEQG
jgi:uncharacterized protein YxjI